MTSSMISYSREEQATGEDTY